MGDRDRQFQMNIRNCGGVPVVEIAGALNRAALKAVESTIATLSSAGHYNIVLNVKKLADSNIAMTGKLKRSAASIARHHGVIDIVADASQLGNLVPLDGIVRFFRFCTSENEAIRRIKKLTRSPESSEQGCSARIVEAK